MEEERTAISSGSSVASIEILVFGIARDIVGARVLSFNLALPCTVLQLQEALLQAFPAFEELSSLRIAVDMEYAAGERVITGGEEIALIPPVSGG